METVFMMYGFVHTAWASVMGYTMHFDISTIVLFGAITFLIAFRRGAYQRRLSDAVAARSQAMWRRNGFDEEYNAREERKLKAEKSAGGNGPLNENGARQKKPNGRRQRLDGDACSTRQRSD